MTDNWRSRIVGHGEEAPDQMLANPRNWRTHPPSQREAVTGLLDEVGWVQDVIVNRTTGNVIDGHLRIEEALTRDEPMVPVVYVELTEKEEGLVLAALDPLAALAGRNEEALTSLLGDAETNSAALRAMFDGMGASIGSSPDEFPVVDETLDTEHECPKCGYQWSGKG